jgi:hypothetical protein
VWLGAIVVCVDEVLLKRTIWRFLGDVYISILAVGGQQDLRASEQRIPNRRRAIVSRCIPCIGVCLAQ